MSELLRIAKKIAEPFGELKQLVVLNVAYRVSLMITSLILARILGQIIQAVAVHASFEKVMVFGVWAL